MTEREKIFGKIREALDPLPERTAYPQWDTSITISRHGHSKEEDVELFRERMESAKGLFFKGWKGLHDFLKEQGATSGYIDKALMKSSGSTFSDFELSHKIERERIDSYAFGITQASGGIAESGTIILRDSDSPYRLASLAPWIHVAVLSSRMLFRTFPEAMSRLGKDPSIVLVTGPSKTADVEGILIQGVHGPGIQAVCLIED